MRLDQRLRQHAASGARLAHRSGVGVRTTLVLALVIGAMAVAASASSSSPPPATAFASSIAELSIDTGQANHLGDTSGYGYVILQEYMFAHVAQIKNGSPNTKVLAYFEAPVTQARACPDASPPAYAPHDSFGINFCYAQASHPEWFLHNSSGQRLTYANYPRDTLMDIGNQSYQKTWAANAIAAARADGFDGVYLDDVNTYPGHGVGQLAEYTDQTYGNAMTSFVAAVADQIRASGLLVAANVAASPWVTWQRKYGLSIASHLSAYIREHYVRYGDICGPFSERFNTTADNGTPPIGEMLRYDEAVQAAGAHLIGIDYGYSPATRDDLAAMTYGRAAFLLAWDGTPGSAYGYRPCGTVDPANTAWSVDLGTPTTPPVLTGAVYHRSYTGGLVLLNPSPDRPATVSVPVGYTDARGTPLSDTATLAPQTALLLRTRR